MKGKDLVIAQRNILKAALMLNHVTIGEMRYSNFNKLKELICDAANKISENRNVAVVISNPFDSLSILAFFDEYYPRWRDNTREWESKIPRQVMQYIFATQTKIPLTNVGRISGGHDHTTVLSSKRTVANMIETEDTEYLMIYNHAMAEIPKVKPSPKVKIA